MEKYYCKNPFSGNCTTDPGPEKYNTNCPDDFYSESYGFISNDACLLRCNISEGNCDNAGRPYDDLFEPEDEPIAIIIDNLISDLMESSEIAEEISDHSFVV